MAVSVSTMTYCVVQINFLPLPRFLKEVTMKTAEERDEETWNSYLELPFFDTSKKAYKMPYKTFSAIMSGICLKSLRYRKRLKIPKF